MDWTNLFLFLYLVITTPFTFFGFLTVYTLVYAFFSARVERRDLDD